MDEITQDIIEKSKLAEFQKAFVSTLSKRYEKRLMQRYRASLTQSLNVNANIFFARAKGEINGRSRIEKAE